MYYIIANVADLIKSETDAEGNTISVMPETTRVSVDGLSAILDDVQFATLGIEDLDCQMLSHKRALALMETVRWKEAVDEL